MRRFDGSAMNDALELPSWGTCHPLDATCRLFSTFLPDALAPQGEELAALWQLHPAASQTIRMYGRSVPIPRFQQAYGRDYRFSGQVSRALPLPALLEPLLAWCTEHIDPRLNGLLVNWYDAAHEHYIGPHRDKVTGLVRGAPIVTISLGASRTFRLRPWRAEGVRDFLAVHRAVFVMPFATNAAWTHEVPHFAHDQGRRISVTARAFER
jgi:alkylated DNA repair dioxygenase AlkB